MGAGDCFPLRSKQPLTHSVICSYKEMIDYELFKPIRICGSFIMAFGVAGIICLIIFINDPEFMLAGGIFVLVVSSFNLFMGYNIVARNRLGFKCLKIYLYMIYPGFPLGYFYAKKALEYIKENNIERFYEKTIKI